MFPNKTFLRTHSSVPRFHEIQRFRQPWIVALVAVLAGMMWGMFAQQIVRGRPVGNHPMSDPALVVLTVLMGGALPIFIWRLTMETSVFDDRVEVRMQPLSRRTLPAAQIAGAQARTYQPLREFGGRGIRGWSSNRAYNVSGDQGVQLVLTNGDRILIGSQQPEALATAIVSLLPSSTRP